MPAVSRSPVKISPSPGEQPDVASSLRWDLSPQMISMSFEQPPSDAMPGILENAPSNRLERIERKLAESRAKRQLVQATLHHQAQRRVSDGASTSFLDSMLHPSSPSMLPESTSPQRTPPPPPMARRVTRGSSFSSRASLVSDALVDSMRPTRMSLSASFLDAALGVTPPTPPQAMAVLSEDYERIIRVADERQKHAMQLSDRGCFKEALEVYRALLLQKQQQDDVFDDKSREEVELKLADILSNIGEYNEALQTYEKVVQAYVSKGSMDSELLLSALERVGNVYEQQGKLDQAMEMYQRSLSIRVKQADPSSADIAKTKCNIADVHHAKGDPGRALSLYQEALDSLIKALGPHHAKVAATQNSVANVLSDLGRLDEALELYQKSLETELKLHAADHYIIADTCNNIGVLYYHQGKLDEAFEMYKRSQGVYERVYSMQHLKVAASQNNIANLLFEEQRYGEALAMYQRSLAIEISVLGSDHCNVASTQMNMGRCYQKQALTGAALQMYEAAQLTFMQKNDVTSELAALECLDHVCSILTDHAKFNDALRVQHQILACQEKHFGPTHSRIAETMDSIIFLLQRTGTSKAEIQRCTERARSIRAANGSAHSSLSSTTAQAIHRSKSILLHHTWLGRRGSPAGTKILSRGSPERRAAMPPSVTASCTVL